MPKKTIYLLIVLSLSFATTFGLTMLIEELFTWKNTLPATLTYFSLYWLLTYLVLGSFSSSTENSRNLDKKIETVSTEEKETESISWISSMLEKFGLLFLLSILSVIFAEKVHNKEKEVESFGWISSILRELGLFFFLSILSIVFAMIASLVWWVCGGYELRTIYQALFMGMILGGLVIIILFAGSR